ncbi:hypothetical protein DUI87_31033 [Hirundo rustica rustica]|uniref:Uncharacterized protein n=1 Tax=Hirundo rustica rustica TaxID=333673 RepID=A0A3M0J0K8_HIRRU|nr:hypothetical protein DUI87_31033 [Hirundo rustica rustica]
MAAEKAGKVKDPEVRLAGCLRAILTTTRPEREFPRRFEVPGKCRTRTDTEFLGTLAEREKQQMVLGEFLLITDCFAKMTRNNPPKSLLSLPSPRCGCIHLVAEGPMPGEGVSPEEELKWDVICQGEAEQLGRRHWPGGGRTFPEGEEAFLNIAVDGDPQTSQS